VLTPNEGHVDLHAWVIVLARRVAQVCARMDDDICFCVAFYHCLYFEFLFALITPHLKIESVNGCASDWSSAS
jgi:hypothetical protein